MGVGKVLGGSGRDGEGAYMPGTYVWLRHPRQFPPVGHFLMCLISVQFRLFSRLLSHN